MIKIEELKECDGAEVGNNQTVEVKYAGSFPDGKAFDNGTFSFKTGSGQVIQGFDLGVMGMKVGGKRRVTIPPELGYGSRGAGGAIPPNATLIFELEIKSVK
ncbi:FKBP-type peptidyl-prolyl cis-trans isomerase [soil metagenome]